MKTSLILGLGLALSFLVASPRTFAATARLPEGPALSPDGKTLAFAWDGDIWVVPVEGGTARPLTRNPARDHAPSFSPDGRRIAFLSNRDGADQVYVMPAAGGLAMRLTFHSEGCGLEGWYPDGQDLLIWAARDHHWRDAGRFFRIESEDRSAERLLFDTDGEDGSLSPDGKKLLFNREGLEWWRKGYRGSRASQVWLADLSEKTFTKILDPEAGARWPLWRPDGEGFFYVGTHNGALNLRVHDLNSGEDRPLTEFDDDSVTFPCLSADGSTLVFRHLFDLYRLRPEEGGAPVQIKLSIEGDVARDPIERQTLDRATDVTFSADGLEIAFIAGGDLWVMDTELKEPRQITATPEEESDPAFAPDGGSIVFVSERDGQSDLWKAERGDASAFWWRNREFKLERITHDAETDAEPSWNPDGTTLAFIRGRGDLWLVGPRGEDARRLIASWDAPEFEWSPDGRWLAYAVSDPDFNKDVWIAPVDGSRPPFNLSRHPFNESAPTWSPDGRKIAFTGRREGDEIDIYYVWLREEDDDKTRRDRTIDKATEAIQKSRKSKPAKPDDPDKKTDVPPGGAEPEAEKPVSNDKVEVRIDFDRLHERVRRIPIPNSTETGLIWSPDSKRLAFSTSIDGNSGTFTVEIPDELKPKRLAGEMGGQGRWLEKGDKIVWISGRVPASLTGAGKATSYPFRAPQEFQRPEHLRAAFDQCWRLMRDRYYDENLGNRNWDAIRRKYADAAAESPDLDTFETVVNLMLGELNGSHLGFRARGGGGGSEPSEDPETPRRWLPQTAHLGIRFDPDGKGPGLKVRDLIPDGPADRADSRIAPGEVVLAIDGASVDPGLDLTTVLNGLSQRDIQLRVRNPEGIERDVTIRPIPFPMARSLLYEKWIRDNRKHVDEISGGRLGYLHIQGMNFTSFYRFEEELYSAGTGKDGLIIDVRENGGGSTTDHLLTALTQPVHAITVPRGGGPGYPNDRKVYATWSKPIVVLCNQNSFSNAEIFSHAIKTLGRGPLVGVPTAGGVISTGSASIMDVGTLRMPTRGWFLLGDGEDMELHGAVPDHVLWPEPADFALGLDRQLDKAVEVLEAEVEADAARSKPRLQKSSER